MCGIAGYFGANDKQLLRNMAKAIKHRGPDDGGFFFHKNVGLANRRLSIIDIKSGHQPIVWKNLSIVYNGEIYNYQDIRAELEDKYDFKTNSDTEVILYAYQEWGPDCVKKFNGMWSFAIYDKIKNILFISRDRLGIKPLYYYYDGEKIVFASEIKAILEDKTIPRIPNDEIVYGYLLYNLHDHSEKTFFKGIKSLPPGHSMVVRKNSMKIMKYWGIEIKSIKDSDEKYAINTRELLEDSIKLRLISEVPIGSCLSGGIDSTSIVSLINNVIKSGGNYDNTIGERQKTFSAVYKNNKIDESKHIENVISYTGAEKNFTYPTAKGLWKDIRKIVYHQDEPFIGPSIYAQWEVMKLASKKVKVVLDGQGSDEIFAGYMPYHIIHIMNLVKHGRILRAGQEFIKSADFIVPFIFSKSVFKKRDKTIKSMLNNIFVDKYNNIIQSKWKVKNLNDLLYLEVTKQSIPKLLRYEDRNSMAFSVEARVPFLDYRLVEYAFSMPEKQKIRKGWTKYVLRNAMKGIIPESVRKRRDKIGFDVPEKKWLLELKKPVKQLFASKSFGEIKYFDQIEVLKMFDKFCKGKLDDNYARVFWRIIILAIWHDTFIRKLT